MTLTQKWKMRHRTKANNLCFSMIVLVFLSLVNVPLYAQHHHASIPAADWVFTVDKELVMIGDVITVTFEAPLEEGIHIYSSDFDPSCGPLVSELVMLEDPSFAMEGRFNSHGAETHFDDIFKCEIKYFSDKAVFTQMFKIMDINPSISGTMYYQMCDDETCVGHKYNFDLSGSFEVSDATGEPETKSIPESGNK